MLQESLSCVDEIEDIWNEWEMSFCRLFILLSFPVSLVEFRIRASALVSELLRVCV